jgi:hypothetical protein
VLTAVLTAASVYVLPVDRPTEIVPIAAKVVEGVPPELSVIADCVSEAAAPSTSSEPSPGAGSMVTRLAASAARISVVRKSNSAEPLLGIVTPLTETAPDELFVTVNIVYLFLSVNCEE